MCFLISFFAFGQEPPSRLEVSRAPVMKVATVDIQKLFQGYRKTLVAEREIDLARAEIQKKSQLATNEIQKRRRVAEQRIFNVRKGDASEAEIADLQRELPIITRELQMAEQQKSGERATANQALNKQMVRRMAGILEEIVELTAKKADSEGFDMVIDISGSNSNQVIPMLFAKNATDMTPLMEKELSKSGDDKR
ncbi:MAG: OmpH family outer membrane protein [Roseibacillus sp.]